MAFWALIKIVSLGYILGLATLSLATLLWYFLRPRITPALRADVGFIVLMGSFTLNTLIALVILLGVINGQILMTTYYFHRLMDGGWGMTITLTGGVLLGVSLLLAWIGWQRGHVPTIRNKDDQIIMFAEQALLMNTSVATMSLVGAWRPELWVNPAYWAKLSDEHRRYALAHEQVHLLRRDNFKRLLMMFVVVLYLVLPWMRRWLPSYELDCELAVDDVCRQTLPERGYVTVVANATEHILSWEQPAVASHLSCVDQTSRLEILSQPRITQVRYKAWLVGALSAILSVVPVTALLFNPISRCLCACYLGY